jgi:DNA-binding winged helix-turn-helix (wHTH) protein
MGHDDFVFGPFHFEPRQRLLWRGDEILPLGRRAASLLEILLRQRGDVVRKNDLIDTTWPGEAVEESNLTVQIASLRRIIGAQWIMTVERVGYRFLAAPPVSARRGNMIACAFPSIALLLTDTDDCRSARDLLNGIAASLARNKSIRLIALTYPEARSFPVRWAAHDAGADYLVSLTPRFVGHEMVGAAANLVEAERRTIVWAHSFNLVAGASMEDRIAASIASEVQAAELLGGPRRDVPGAEAYGLYLRGTRALHTSRADDNRVAFKLLTAALDLEPDNPTYVAAASEAIHHRLSVGWEAYGSQDKRVGLELARRAHALAGSDAAALALAGNTYFTVDEEDLGLALCHRALEMDPNNLMVLVCAGLAEAWGGSIHAHEQLFLRAADIAPNDPGQRFALGGLAVSARWRGDFEQELFWARKSLAVGPGFSRAHLCVVDALVRLNMRGEAELHLGRYLAMSPGVSISSVERGQHYADRLRIAPLIESLRLAGMPEH